jgi:hypothetical protein
VAGGLRRLPRRAAAPARRVTPPGSAKKKNLPNRTLVNLDLLVNTDLLSRIHIDTIVLGTPHPHCGPPGGVFRLL